MLKGAIFDHDGLMFDTEKIWQKNWNEIAMEMGITLPEEFKHDISGTNGDLMRSVICRYYHVEDGHAIQEECVRRVQKDESIHIDAKPGLSDILNMFQKHGVKMAVASSSPKDMLLRNLKNAGIDTYFDAVVSGTEVKRGKPYPDIFLEAAEDLCLDPRECYVFEDAYNGVRAGHAAGCETIMVPDLVQPDDEIRSIADGVCTTLKEAAEKIENGEL